jgi:hypothetical protein
MPSYIRVGAFSGLGKERMRLLGQSPSPEKVQYWRAGALSTGESQDRPECAHLTGVVIVAPPETPRNAEGRKAKAALVVDGPVQRGRQYTHYKRGRGSTGLRPANGDGQDRAHALG